MNILILTGNFGMGHTSAAKAIAERISLDDEDSNVYVEDLFRNAFNSSHYDFMFRLMVKKGRFFYNKVYRHTKDTEKQNKMPFGRHFRRCIDGLISETDADIIISTLWSCSKAVSEYKRETGSSIPLITCITDISSHSEWIQPLTDFYMAATPEVKAELVHKNIDPQRVIVSGVPVRCAFGEAAVPTEHPGEKRLLIMGGGLGLLPKTKSFYERINSLCGVKTTVITGSNTALCNTIYGKYENIEVLSFVNDVPRYMKDSDLMISKPGGITLFEAISAELPLLIFKPFLQHEKRNGEFILENGIGDVLPEDESDWTEKIKEMLNSGDKLRDMRANMHNLKSVLDESALPMLLRQFERQSVSA